MCGERGETVQHIICDCKKLAQREYKWYEHCPEGTVEDDDVKLIWDINMECDNVIDKETRLNFGRQKGEIMRHH